MHRTKTKPIHIGNRVIGCGKPILIQSMTNTRTEDIKATTTQILKLEAAGCEIIRVAVPTLEAASAITEIKQGIHIPLVADIHFDHRLALAAIANGADKIRINPGNIGGQAPLKEIVKAAKEKNIPIRVGVNSGSLEKKIIAKYKGLTADGLVESALDKVGMIEEAGYDNIVISLKSSDVMMTVEAYQQIAARSDYPLHLGITEAGTVFAGGIKSAIGLALILKQGIGDTIRVSLTGDPLEEVRAAKIILRTLGLRCGGIEVVSCPTCGRTEIDLIGLAQQVEEMVESLNIAIAGALKIAVMGCVVNGPGEAREADLGIAGGKGEGLLFRKGEIIKKLPEEELLAALREEIINLNKEENNAK
jgi:(E)-4-hydroxy-3-methylbut-2-enyl-diphosphate synthase